MKIARFVITCLVAVGLAGCATSTNPEDSASGNQSVATTERTEKATATNPTMVIKASPDKYTWYVRDYVGMNAASVGYASMDGFRRDAYGDGTLKIVFIAPDGVHLNPNDNALQEYVVVAQNLEPNYEIKYAYQVNSDGEEYSNLVSVQSQEEIALTVKKVGAQDEQVLVPKAPSASPDKYTRYVKDYIGRNLADCGYVALSGDYNDRYGNGFVTLDITTDDGSFVDYQSDESALSQYIVIGQSVPVDTPINMTFSIDPYGKEYDGLVASQSIESINIMVSKATDATA